MLKRDIIVPLLLLLFVLILSCCFIIKDGVPFAHDDLNHFRHSMDFKEILAGKESPLEKLHHLIHYTNPFPPLYFVLSAIIFLFTGVSAKAALLTNLFLALVLTLCFFSMALKISDRPGLSLLIAVSLLCFPLVTAMSRLNYLDFALMVFVTIAYTFLMRSDGGKKTHATVLFGIASALALLCKWTAVVFIAGGFIFLMMAYIQSQKRRILVNLTAAFLLAVLISGWWYGLHFNEIVDRYANSAEQFHVSGWGKLDPDLWIYISYLFYSLGPYFWIFILTGIFLAIRKKRSYMVIVALWFILPYLIFSILPAKVPRYLLPAIPALALPLVELGNLKLKKASQILPGLLVLICALTLTALTFFSQKDASCFGLAPTPKSLFMDKQRYAFRIQPAEDADLYKKILEIVMNDASPVKALALVPYQGHLLTREILRYHASILGMADDLIILSPYRLPRKILPLKLFDATYYLVKKGPQFYINEEMKLQWLENYLQQVTGFVFDQVGFRLEPCFQFQLNGEKYDLLKLKNEWQKQEIADFLLKVRSMNSTEKTRVITHQHLLVLPQNLKKKPDVISSFYIVRGAKRLREDEIQLCLPCAELVFHPPSPGVWFISLVNIFRFRSLCHHQHLLWMCNSFSIKTASGMKRSGRVSREISLFICL